MISMPNYNRTNYGFRYTVTKILLIPLWLWELMALKMIYEIESSAAYNNTIGSTFSLNWFVSTTGEKYYTLNCFRTFGSIQIHWILFHLLTSILKLMITTGIVLNHIVADKTWQSCPTPLLEANLTFSTVLLSLIELLLSKKGHLLLHILIVMPSIFSWN